MTFGSDLLILVSTAGGDHLLTGDDYARYLLLLLLLLLLYLHVFIFLVAHIRIEGPKKGRSEIIHLLNDTKLDFYYHLLGMVGIP